MSEITEESLVLQAIDGSHEAFAGLYDRHFNKVYRYVYFKVTSKSEAEDITQEVFLKALGAIGNYKPRQVPFTAWLFRIAHNEVVDYYRSRSKKETVQLNENVAYTTVDPVAIAEHTVDMESVNKAILKLTPAQREVITLRFAAEMSIAEVAGTLKKSEGTIKALQFTATVSLRKLLMNK